MSFCKKQLNGFQRRSLRLFGITLLATALLFVVNEHVFGMGHGSAWADAISAFTALPFLAMVLLIPRYLRQEKDEFVRMLMVRAVLWGFAVPMVIDTVWGFLWRFWPVDVSMAMLRVMPMVNVDLFCIAALIAVRVQGRRYQ